MISRALLCYFPRIQNMHEFQRDFETELKRFNNLALPYELRYVLWL